MISVILPTYNERENVLILIEALRKELCGYHYEILVVDDSSLDGTYQAVVKLAQPDVKAVLRMENSGLAAAICCGLETAVGDVFVVMDSDGNHQPHYLSFMLSNLEEYDCVSASRFLPGGGMRSWFRQFCSHVFNIFIRFMLGIKVTDSLYGYFAIKKVALANVPFEKIFWGYGDYAFRLFYYLQRYQVRILEFPAKNGLRKFGEGNPHLVKTFFQYFGEVVQFMWKVRITGHA